MVVEQPSSFAGWRSVDNLRLVRVKGGDGDSSPTPSTSRADTSALHRIPHRRQEVLEERREGDCTTFTCLATELASRAAPKTKRESAPSGMWKKTKQPLLVSSACMSFSPPQEGGVGLRTGQRRAARFFRTAGASLRRGGNSNEATSIEREDRPLPGVPVCRCLKVPLQKS